MADNPTESTTTEQEAAKTEAVGTAPTDKLGDPGLAALRTERDARKTAEKQLRDAQSKLAAFEDANKTEAQRLTDNATKAEQRAAAAEQRLTQALTRQAIIDAALAAGTIDADSVTTLALATGEVTVGDDGQVAGAKQAVAALAKTKPHLFRPAGAGARDATAGGNTTPAQSMDDWIRGN